MAILLWPLHLLEIILLPMRLSWKVALCYCRRHPRYCWPLHFYNLVGGSEDVCFNKVISLVIMKMKNESHRYDMNRPTSDHGHKYTKYRQCLCMMLICNK